MNKYSGDASIAWSGSSPLRTLSWVIAMRAEGSSLKGAGLIKLLRIIICDFSCDSVRGTLICISYVTFTPVTQLLLPQIEPNICLILASQLYKQDSLVDFLSMCASSMKPDIDI